MKAWRRLYADAVPAMGAELAAEVDAAAEDGWVVHRVSGWSQKGHPVLWVVQLLRGGERRVVSRGGSLDAVQMVLEALQGTLPVGGWYGPPLLHRSNPPAARKT